MRRARLNSAAALGDMACDVIFSMAGFSRFLDTDLATTPARGS